MIIIPIASTIVDWPNYTKEASNSINRSPTRSLDSANIPIGTGDSFLASLAEFETKDTNPTNFLHSNNVIFRHFHITFLCETEREEFNKIIRLTNYGCVFTTNDEDYKTTKFIVTGSIYTWKEVILFYLSNDYHDIVLRDFLHIVYKKLEFKQFRIMFSNYRETRLIDGSWILEKKS